MIPTEKKIFVLYNVSMYNVQESIESLLEIEEIYFIHVLYILLNG